MFLHPTGQVRLENWSSKEQKAPGCSTAYSVLQLKLRTPQPWNSPQTVTCAQHRDTGRAMQVAQAPAPSCAVPSTWGWGCSGLAQPSVAALTHYGKGAQLSWWLRADLFLFQKLLFKMWVLLLCFWSKLLKITDLPMAINSSCFISSIRFEISLSEEWQKATTNCCIRPPGWFIPQRQTTLYCKC